MRVLVGLLLVGVLVACSSDASVPVGGSSAGSSAGEVEIAPSGELDGFLGVGDSSVVGAVGVSGPAGNTSAGVLDLTGPARRVRVQEDPRWVVAQVVAGGVRFDVFHADNVYRGILLTPDGEVASREEPLDVITVRDVPPLVEGMLPNPGGTMIDRVYDGPDRGSSAEFAVVGEVVREAGSSTEYRVPVTAVVDVNDDLRIEVLAENGPTSVAGPFLPDARPVLLGDGTVAVLADPTEAYDHGVIGDPIEAGSVAIVDIESATIVRRLTPEAGRVIEQRRVLATELDGASAVVVTTSSPDDGARVEVWTTDGDRRIVSDAIGRGGRWRHVIGVAELTDGGIEIAEVITPHLGRIASFLQIEGDRLVQVSAAPDAIASHSIRSRNLDQAALVDLNGDGRRDLVGPAADGDGLAWVIAGEDAANQTDAGNVMVTNLAMVQRPDGTVVIAYGTKDGNLVIHG